jgi:hypothetical protein
MFRLFVDDHPMDDNQGTVHTNKQVPVPIVKNETAREAESDSFTIVNHKLEYSNANNINSNLIDSTTSLKTAMETLHSPRMEPSLQQDPPVVADDNEEDGSSAASDLSLDPEELSTVESILDQFSIASVAVAGDKKKPTCGIERDFAAAAGMSPARSLSVMVPACDQENEHDPNENARPDLQPAQTVVFQIPDLSVTEHLATNPATVPQENEEEQDDNEDNDDDKDDRENIPSVLLQWLGMQNALSLYMFLGLIMVLVASWMFGQILVPMDREVTEAKMEVLAKRTLESPLSRSSLPIARQMFNHTSQDDTENAIHHHHPSIMMSAGTKQSRDSAAELNDDEIQIESPKACVERSEIVPVPAPTTAIFKDSDVIPMTPTMARLFQRADTAFLPTVQKPSPVDNKSPSMAPSPIFEPAVYDVTSNEKMSMPVPTVSMDNDDISTVTNAVWMFQRAESFFRHVLGNTHKEFTLMAHPFSFTGTSSPVMITPMLMQSFQDGLFLPHSLWHHFQISFVAKVRSAILYFLRLAGCMLSVILLMSFLFWKLCRNSTASTTNSPKMPTIKNESSTNPKTKSNMMANKLAIPSTVGWSATPFLKQKWDLTQFSQLHTFLSECHNHWSGKGRRGKNSCRNIGHCDDPENNACAQGFGYEMTNYEKLTKEELLVLCEGFHVNPCPNRQDKSTIIRKVTANYEASLTRFRVEELTAILAVKGIDVVKTQKTYTKKKDLIKMVVEAGF